MMQMVTCTLRFWASRSAAAAMVLIAARFKYLRVGRSAATLTARMPRRSGRIRSMGIWYTLAACAAVGNYNVDEGSMERIAVESIPIMVGREEDGRWWADIEAMPGVMAYGDTRESAVSNVRALALRVAADCIDHGEEIPEPFAKVFSVA
jgi:predicted RNase H-like HicB family nuclease